MIDTPLISVIVPVYKTEQFLDRCLQSVIGQTYTHWEILLIDDGSPDHSGELCDRYAQQDKRIFVRHQPNGGLSDARNTGLSMAHGDWIYFLDSDDFLLPEEFSSLLAYSENGTYDIVAGHSVSVKNKRMITTDKDVVYENNIETIRRQSLSGHGNMATGKLIKRVLFTGIRFPVGYIREDAIVMPKLYLRARKACIVPTAYYCYSKENPESLSNGIHLKNRLEFMYGGFVEWQEKLQFCKQLGYAEAQAICQKQISMCGLHYLLYCTGVKERDRHKEREVYAFIQTCPTDGLSKVKRFQQYCVRHHWRGIIGGMGKIMILSFRLRTYFRKRRWKKYGIWQYEKTTEN